eukprot:10101959-Alexandrium_andersonii.AAC.1
MAARAGRPRPFARLSALRCGSWRTRGHGLPTEASPATSPLLQPAAPSGLGDRVGPAAPSADPLAPAAAA